MKSINTVKFMIKKTGYSKEFFLDFDSDNKNSILKLFVFNWFLFDHVCFLEI